MKRLLTILFILISFIGAAQVYTPQAAAGYGYKRVRVDSTLHIPSFCGTPFLRDTSIKHAALAFDSCGHKLYFYDPKTLAWDTIKGGGSGQIIIAGTNLTTDSIPEGSFNHYATYDLIRSALSATYPEIYDPTTGTFSLDTSTAIIGLATKADLSHIDTAVIDAQGYLSGDTTIIVFTKNGGATNSIKLLSLPETDPTVSTYIKGITSAYFDAKVDKTTTLTINGATFDLSANRSWTIATSGGTVTGVTGTSPLHSSGGITPNITIDQSSSSTNGYLSSTDWATFNGKQPAGSYLTSFTETDPLSVHISDSAAMLNHYLKSIVAAATYQPIGSYATITQLNLKVNISDTGAMLLPYKNEINTNTTNITANTTAITGKQNTITTGTTSQYFRGDLSLATFPAIPAAIDTTPLHGQIANLNSQVTTNSAGIITNSTNITTNTTSINNRYDSLRRLPGSTQVQGEKNGVWVNAFVDSTGGGAGGVTTIANGGTNATTANTALNNLLPTQTGNSGKVLQTDGSNTAWQGFDFYSQYPLRGNLWSETWANTSSWTTFGSPTTSVSGGYLSITDAAGGDAFSKYIYYSAYGAVDIKPIKITTSIVVGTMSSTSYCPKIGFYGGNSMVVSMDLTTGANSGKINWYYDSAAPVRTSTAALAVVSGDTLDFTFELRKDQYTVTYKDRNNLKGQSITDMFYASSYLNRPVPPAIKYYAVIEASGATVHKIGPVTFSSDAPKNATIMEVGNSLVQGTALSSLDNNVMSLLMRSCKGIFLTYASPGNRIEDINVQDVLNLTPTKIVMRMGVNNVNAGQTATQVMTNLRTFMNACIAGGYTLGTSLFIGTILPETQNNVTPYNDSIVAFYGASGAVADFNKTLRGATATTMNPTYYSYDGLHFSDFAALALVNTYISFFGLTKLPYSTTQQYLSPTTDGKLVLGRISSYPYSYITMADPTGDIAVKNDTLRSSGFHIITTGVNTGKIGTGISYNGTNFINEATSQALWGSSRSTFSVLVKTGLTIGAISTISASTDCKFLIDSLGNVAINKNPADAIKYPFDVSGTTNTGVNIHTTSSAEDGLYITAAATGGHISQGGAIVSANWTAKATTFASFSPNSGVFRFFANTGLTSGNTFTPTIIANLSTSGLRIGSSTAAVDKLDVEGNLSLVTAGNKIKIATGTNASVGTSAAMTAGTITISTTAVTAGSIIQLTGISTAAPPCATCGVLSVGTISAGASFVINSSLSTDTRAVYWTIIN